MTANNSDYDSISVYLESIRSIPMLSSEEEILLGERIGLGDRDARNRLVESNLRLVVKIAMDYSVSDENLMDLIQDGNTGLMRAAEKFDVKHKVKFSTYACYWIKSSISRSLIKRSRAIHIPVRAEAEISRISNSREHLSVVLGREPSCSEISAFSGIPEKKISKLLATTSSAVSLDVPIGDTTSSRHEVCGDNRYHPEIDYSYSDLKECTKKLLDRLQDREREVLKYRYSFYDGKRYSLKAVATKMGLSSEAVRQIEKRAVKKLQGYTDEVSDFYYTNSSPSFSGHAHIGLDVTRAYSYA